ncbi:hypothetical protein POTOM_031097 [Populus tomentosa]|uniref:UBC core domain-containing protein n=1 Tax=Populus tomentosa TaxID=118781 RepID=A0A8X7Z5T0_POPTO|nr:hypothetical protein POTOM_031097 [Populus tomentosa]
MAASQASLLLQKQLRNLCKNPVDGFSAGLIDENNVFEWNVTIIGPPDTLYEGGFFNATMSFPQNYPVSPPTVRFTSEVWHPNVYANGKVCISILHPPGDDPNGYELATERWSPVHTGGSSVHNCPPPPQSVLNVNTNSCVEEMSFCIRDIHEISCSLLPWKASIVESIVLSIISMLSSPNDESPANVDAAHFNIFLIELLQKQWRENRDEFKKKVSRCVRKSQEMM